MRELLQDPGGDDDDVDKMRELLQDPDFTSKIVPPYLFLCCKKKVLEL